MEKILIASMEKSAGKTSIITGLAKAFDKKIGYMKPLGDRLIYHKKRLWDYDSALMVGIFGMKESPEDMTIGFEHTKLRYMYDAEKRKKKLLEMTGAMGRDKDVLFIEGGRDLKYGGCISLDSFSVAKYIDARLYIVVSGDDDTIVDDAVFIKNHINLQKIDFGGIIVNKVKNTDDFKETYLKMITDLGIQVLGIIPYKPELTQLSMNYIAYRIFAKKIAGEGAPDRIVKHIFIGAATADSTLLKPLFQRENKLVITSGDRVDMILAALEGSTAGIILTNNILPPSSVISKANEHNIPLLLAMQDTYQITKQLDDIEPLLMKEDTDKITLLDKLVKEHLSIKKMM